MTDMPAADVEAARRVASVEPVWDAQIQAKELLGEQKLVLHAGPPFARWEDVPEPVRNSLAFAVIYEGWASSWEQAREQLASGNIAFEPAQDHGVVVPLAGVCSASMSLHRVRDATGTAAVKYAVINEGMTHMTRVGRLDDGLLAHHAWLNGALAEELSQIATAPLALQPLLASSLIEGDDGHSRTVAGSRAIVRQLNDRIPLSVTAREFLDASPAFALNLWMATAALCLAAAEGVAGSTLVTRAGGNGHCFGIQIARQPGIWRATPADPPSGPLDPGNENRCATGALGDSAVVDFLGYGGMTLSDAPAVAEALSDYLPADALTRRQLLHKAGFGTACAARVGVTATAVTAHARGPIVLLGMIDAAGTQGRLGGGAYQPPRELFR